MRKNKKCNRKYVWLIFAILLCLIVIAIVVGRNGQSEEKHEIKENAFAEQGSSSDANIDIGNGMTITEIGKYTGIYMEDGTNEEVADVLMIEVKNEGKNTIQYAEIRIPVQNEEAKFALSTLAPGDTAILLEQNRMKFAEVTSENAIAENVAIFTNSLNLHEDKLNCQILDGAMNVSNISGKAIDEDIVIYYKNKVDGIYYGGITYRIRIEGGLGKDEIRQGMAQHLSNEISEIVFVTIGAEL